MALPVPYPLSGALRFCPRASVPLTLVAIALCGCSINLGSLSSKADHQVRPQAVPSGTEASEAQAITASGEALVRSGKNEEALAEFNKAITLDPNNAQALYNRGLLYQSDQQPNRRSTTSPPQMA